MDTIRPHITFSDARTLINVLHSCWSLNEIRGYLTGEELTLVTELEIRLRDTLDLAIARREIKASRSS